MPLRRIGFDLKQLQGESFLPRIKSGSSGVAMRYTGFLFCCWFLGWQSQGFAAADERLAVIKRLGELNGIALNCGALSETQRMKQALVLVLPKQKQLGELFDYETNRSFIKLIQEEAACPATGELHQKVAQALQELEMLSAAAPARRTFAAAETDASPSDVGIGGGRFMLMDQYGGLVTPESLLGRYQLLYFGYTHCPDICPNTLQVVSLALDRLGPKAKLIQPYFVTVDPQRDTIKVLREYIDYFDPRFIGVTGSPTMIERMTTQYKVKYEKVAEVSADPQLYLVDHSASLYLMAPDGSFLRKFVYGISAEQLAQELAEILP